MKVKPLAASATWPAARSRPSQPGDGEDEREQDADGRRASRAAPACGRNPIRNATPRTRTVEAALRSALATTCPVRTAGAADVQRPEAVDDAVGDVLATLTAVVAEPNPAHSSMIPGTT